jgi:hypothetical protein
LSLKLFTCNGGDIVLPDETLVLVGRRDGGNLVVNPPREVWERSELKPAELTYWSFLVAATGKAMLDVLPQLKDGCINYWEAGNWALNGNADPKGFKTAKDFRKVHLHLLGRSPAAASSSYKWGEAPKFPVFDDRFEWAAKNDRLSAEECRNITARAETLLNEIYGMDKNLFSPRTDCQICGYPALVDGEGSNRICTECI